MGDPQNPLLSDRDVEFLLFEVLDVVRLCRLPAFWEHSRESFDLFLAGARRFAREVLLPTYREIDQQPPELRDGRVHVHPSLKKIFAQLVDLGFLTATRPIEVGGQQLPLTVAALASAYLMAGNLSAYGYIGLTSGAAHLLESFGSEWLQSEFMARLYSGEWTGTMALTEPQAGSSLGDVKTRAVADGGRFRIQGSKIFISAGDHDLTENVVHLLLARIEGAPAGIKGVSLFAVPNRRRHEGQLVSNDVAVAGMIHKIGWRGLPSLALNFGEGGDCMGWLVGAPNQGIACMFQLMNEARIMIGMNGVATASVAYHESLAYARLRPQGRPYGARDPASPQAPIIEHSDVRRMLLRQKAIVEGGLSLLATASLHADLARHATSPEERHRAGLFADLLTPLGKSFPAEWGYESNTLALQIFGGYGYSTESLPEAWLRDQKLNSIHEGTTGIQSLDLLGRRVVADGGAALRQLRQEIAATIERARRATVDEAWGRQLERATDRVVELTAQLAADGLHGDVERMLRHSFHYLQLLSILVVAWQWLLQAAVASEGLARNPSSRDFYEGKLCAAQYWFAVEVPRIEPLAALCKSGDDSYARLKSEWM